MLVRTIKAHQNTHGDVFEKDPGKQYEVDDHEGANLVQAGLVEEVKAKAGK
jgi:hypothetical protein